MIDSVQMTAADLDIAAVPKAHLHAVIGLCARTMRDNPLHVRVFGDHDDRRERCLQLFFTPTIDYIHRHGLLYGAYANASLVGVFGLLPPGHCRPQLADIPRLLNIFRAASTPADMLRISRWLWAWKRNDPDEPHWHLGPLVIAPEHQGRHFGRHLIAAVAARIGPTSAAAWLETDKARNVRLYESYGFSVAGKTSLMGVTHWFMRGSLAIAPQNRHADC